MAGCFADRSCTGEPLCNRQGCSSVRSAVPALSLMPCLFSLRSPWGRPLREEWERAAGGAGEQATGVTLLAGDGEGVLGGVVGWAADFWVENDEEGKTVPLVVSLLPRLSDP